MSHAVYLPIFFTLIGTSLTLTIQFALFSRKLYYTSLVTVSWLVCCKEKTFMVSNAALTQIQTQIWICVALNRYTHRPGHCVTPSVYIITTDKTCTQGTKAYSSVCKYTLPTLNKWIPQSSLSATIFPSACLENYYRAWPNDRWVLAYEKPFKEQTSASRPLCAPPPPPSSQLFPCKLQFLRAEAFQVFHRCNNPFVTSVITWNMKRLIVAFL